MNHPSELVDAAPGMVGNGTTLQARPNGRHACLVEGCFAGFAATPAAEGAVRFCNRSGPDGGHVNRWNGQSWVAGAGDMQHDRT
jgi:hypothetical protein